MLDSGNRTPVQDQPAVTALSELLNDPGLHARNMEVSAGGVLYEPDTAARNVYFIQAGQVRLYQVGPDNSSRLVEILGAGEWFGTAALAEEGRREYGTRAVVVTQAVVTEVSADRWLAALSRQPQLATEWVRVLAAKVEAARADAACLVFNDCNQRLIRALLHLSRSAAAAPHPEGVVLRITHHQLAQAVGAARETVSLALTQLRLKNVLRTGRNQLFFNPDVLQQLGGPNGRTRPQPPVEADVNEQVA